jgi:general secretion pathway protein I
LTSKGTRGFTSIEVLVALAVVSMALLSLLQMHVLSLKTAANAETRCHAVLLAQEKVATVMGRDKRRRGVQWGRVQRNGRTYTWRTEMTRPSEPQLARLELSGLSQLRVVVTWHDPIGGAGVETTTYIADAKYHE